MTTPSALSEARLISLTSWAEQGWGWDHGYAPNFSDVRDLLGEIKRLRAMQARVKKVLDAKRCGCAVNEGCATADLIAKVEAALTAEPEAFS